MYEYDIALKTLLMRPGGSLLSTLTGASIDRWHNVELSEMRSRRVDLLGETASGDLIHIELQRTNDPAMIWRMAEYAFLINRQFDRWPGQFVLYVGQAPLRMIASVATPTLSFECRMVDIREIDAEAFLASPCIDDNILAVLAKFTDARDAVKRILEHVARCDPARRTLAMQELTILAGLRKLETVIRQETCKMPILDDIMDHDLFGPAIRQGLEKGLEQGLEQGLEKGREQGERLVIFRLITKRFGAIPSWAKQRLESLTAPELEKVELRLLDAKSLDELFA
jgi:predicted transposase YdaD